jgi:hypothetical protein
MVRTHRVSPGFICRIRPAAMAAPFAMRRGVYAPALLPVNRLF